MDRRHFLIVGSTTLAAITSGQLMAFADTYRSLAWPDLLPPGEAESLAKSRSLAFIRKPGQREHGSFDDGGMPMNAIQPGNFKTVKALNGLKVRLNGYVVPLEFSAGKSTVFLLVPYFGACIHAPPPPPNQTVLVRARTAVTLASLSSAVEAQGTLEVSTNTSEMGDSAYLLKLDALRKL